MDGNTPELSIDNMSMEEKIVWPTDILAQFLAALSVQCDIRAQRSWYHLAFLVCKRQDLSDIAKCVPRPILFRIEFEGREETIFTIPFKQASVVCVDVDWGDGCVEKIRDKGAGYAQHRYKAAGEYAVRVFPAEEDSGASGVWLDHLGFEQNRANSGGTEYWWKPLREIVSLGRCGLRSLSALFAFCGTIQSDDEMEDASYYEKLRTDLRNLNVGGISDMSYMFHRSDAFNQPIGGWTCPKSQT
jgi:hypothetical protein